VVFSISRAVCAKSECDCLVVASFGAGGVLYRTPPVVFHREAFSATAWLGSGRRPAGLGPWDRLLSGPCL